jgi:hypothetical protein
MQNASTTPGPLPALLAGHSMLMTAAWSVCVPVGVAFIKRFKAKGDAGDLKVHIGRMCTVCAFTVLGVVLALAWASDQPDDRETTAANYIHAIVGLFVTVLVVVQIAWASQRPSGSQNDSDEKTEARNTWEKIHNRTAVVMFVSAILVQGFTGPLVMPETDMEAAPP